MTDREQEERFRERIGDEPADAKGHDKYPGDSDEDVVERQGHDWQVPRSDEDEGAQEGDVDDALLGTDVEVRYLRNGQETVVRGTLDRGDGGYTIKHEHEVTPILAGQILSVRPTRGG